MASLLLFTSFFLVICMHFSNARLFPTIVKPSSAKSHHHSISLDQAAEKINGGDAEMVERTHADPATPFSKPDQFGGSLITGNEKNDKKIHGVAKDEGSDIVESSSSHNVALLKGKHVEDSKKATVSRYLRKEEANHLEKDDIVVTDYQPPHRKAPIHNK